MSLLFLDREIDANDVFGSLWPHTSDFQNPAAATCPAVSQATARSTRAFVVSPCNTQLEAQEDLVSNRPKRYHASTTRASATTCQKCMVLSQSRRHTSRRPSGSCCTFCSWRGNTDPRNTTSENRSVKNRDIRHVDDQSAHADRYATACLGESAHGFESHLAART